MLTIVEPKKHIDKLWGKQEIRDGDTYRMMRYVLRVDHDGKTLLHNVVTGQLVVLEQDEVEAISKLPDIYNPAMKHLVNEHYLVPECFDEHDCVKRMRYILRRIADEAQKPGLTFYTILPTTACNARCYYCFERDLKPFTMTEDTAEDIVRFITVNCKGQKVRIKWFGGEPTVAANRITQICLGLKKNNVLFSSRMTTNGFLYDEAMIEQAKHTWNLESVILSMDGVGESYNKIKDYIGAKEDPYERVLRNIGLFLEKEIRVWVRMNFDQYNFLDFEELLDDISKRYPPSPFLMVSSHYINGIQIVDGQQRYHGSEAWYNQKMFELNQLSRSRKYMQKKYPLPCLNFMWCAAASKKSVTITPQGKLASCDEMICTSEVKGDLISGITDKALDSSWRQFADDPECFDCILFPDCPRIQKCSGNGKCYKRTENVACLRNAIIQKASQ